MAKLEIRCPVCAKWEYIEILDDATKNVKKGLLAVNIAPGMVCDHSFIAYVDKNLIVRDCFIADFKIEAPETEISQKNEKNAFLDAGSLNFDLIKLNIPEKLMVSIFRGIFLGRKIILISKDQFIHDQIINFFGYAMQDLFDVNIIFMSEAIYLKTKNVYDEYLVFKNSIIIHNKNKVIDSKKLSVEKHIVKKFLAEYDLATGLIILKNEIQKVFEFSKELAEYIKCSQNEKLTSKILMDHIYEKKNERIQKNHLTLLLDIVNYNFKVEIPKKVGVTNFL